MLELKNITKIFAQKSDLAAVRQLNLTINEGEFFSLLGPSGCGKSTLLRMISGTESVTQGQIWLDQQEITEWPSQKRPFNMVFQRYALFPHMSVFDNIAFGLRMKKVSPQDIRKRVQETLELINMSDFADRFPETLSGGQQQRVAVARALVNRPKILLLDEPLSALDQKMREHMQSELRDLQKRLGLTFVYVTHDQEEAFALSDRVAVMNQGKLEQVSSAENLYNNPESLFVAQFVGATSELPSLQDGWIRLVRPENFKISTTADSASHSYSGNVVKKIFRGTHFEVEIDCLGKKLLAHADLKIADSLSNRLSFSCDEKNILKYKETSISAATVKGMA